MTVEVYPRFTLAIQQNQGYAFPLPAPIPSLRALSRQGEGILNNSGVFDTSKNTAIHVCCSPRLSRRFCFILGRKFEIISQFIHRLAYRTDQVIFRGLSLLGVIPFQDQDHLGAQANAVAGEDLHRG